MPPQAGDRLRTMPADIKYTTGSLAQLLGGTLNGCDISITGVNSLKDAGPTEISFISSDRFARTWDQSQAGAAVISAGLVAKGHDPSRRSLIVVDQAQLAMAKLLALFAPPPDLPAEGVHPTAFVHPTAHVGKNPRIGAHVSIGRGAVIGDNVALRPGVRIGEDVRIGNETQIHDNCVIGPRCVLGKRVILQPNVSIGADGFGYRPAADGSSLVKMPHIGNVVIEDEVEIGANSCIDRAKFSATVVGWGTKIDNLVQVAHNCRIGRCCVIAGQAGLAGSVTVGDFVQIGAKAGIAEGISIGNGARIGAASGVMRNVKEYASVLGSPAEDSRSALRQTAALRRLPQLIARIAGRSGK